MSSAESVNREIEPIELTEYDKEVIKRRDEDYTKSIVDALAVPTKLVSLKKESENQE